MTAPIGMLTNVAKKAAWMGSETLKDVRKAASDFSISGFVDSLPFSGASRKRVRAFYDEHHAEKNQVTFIDGKRKHLTNEEYFKIPRKKRQQYTKDYLISLGVDPDSLKAKLMIADEPFKMGKHGDGFPPVKSAIEFGVFPPTMFGIASGAIILGRKQDKKYAKAEKKLELIEKNAGDTIDALIKADFKESDIPAIMGNISVETGGTFDHLQKEKGGKGHGLFQFTGKQLKDYMSWLGKREDSKYHQALFVYSNIYSSSANSPHDIGWKARGLLQDSFDNQISTPMALSPEAQDIIQTSSKTKTFSDVYERPGVPHMDRRLKEAHKYRGMLSE